MYEVVISGTGLFTPEQSIGNEELVASYNEYVDRFNARHRGAIEAGEVEPLEHSSADFIEKASGIRSRYVMDRDGILDPDRMRPRLEPRTNDEPSILAEMAVTAAREALEQAGREGREVDYVTVACSNLERPYPAVAIEVQELLGADGFAFDMNVACSSATFGLQAAHDAIRSGSARRALVVSPEICSAHLNFRDRDSHFIFGDVATAVLVERAEDARDTSDAYRVLGARSRTVFSNNIRNNFGYLDRTRDLPADPDADEDSGRPLTDRLFVQHGRKVFKEVVPIVSELVLDHLEQAGIAVAELRRLWLHQANLNMNNLIAKRLLGRDPDPVTVPVILDEYANTASAGSVIAFHKHRADIESGDRGILCSFGAGYSVGNLILEKV